MKRPVLVALLLAAVGLIVAAGCGGGGSTPVERSLVSRQTASATLTIVIPANPASASQTRKPAYISPDTNSISFLIAGMSSAQVVALDGGGCTSVGGVRTCTADFAAPIGMDEALQVKTFQSTDGSGTPLSMNDVPVTIVQDQTNALTITLNGVVSALGLMLSPSSMQAGTTQTLAATLVEYDSAGDAIVGPGSPEDTGGNPVTATLSSDDTSGATAIGAQAGDVWPVTETNPSLGTITFTAAAAGFTSAMAQLAVTGTPPTPTPTPSPTPDAIENGTFSTGALAPWYLCYAPRILTAARLSAGPINASPLPELNLGTPDPAPTATPVADTTSSVPGDVSIQQMTPSGDLPPSGDTYFVRTGYDNYGYSVSPQSMFPGEPPYGVTPKGNTGICQDITIPSDPAVLSFYVYEGGNDLFFKADDEADIYPEGSFSPDGTNGAAYTGTAGPSTILYAQNNCYDNQAYNYGYLSTPWGNNATTHTFSATSRGGMCPYYPGGIVPAGGNASWAGAPGIAGGGTVSMGGFWYLKQLEVTGYAGQSVTLFLGVSESTHNTPNTTGSATGTSYYVYAFYDDVTLTPPTPEPTPAGALSANPTSLSLLQTGPASFAVTETGYRGHFEVMSSDTTRVTVTSPLTATSDTTMVPLNVPPGAQGGSITVTVTDDSAQSVQVPITLTITNPIIQGAHKR